MEENRGNGPGEKGSLLQISHTSVLTLGPSTCPLPDDGRPGIPQHYHIRSGRTWTLKFGDKD